MPRHIFDGEPGFAPTIADLGEPVQLQRWPWNRRDQRFGVGMLRVAHDLFGRATFDHFAGIHDRHSIGRIGDHPHVMGDQDDPNLPFPRQLLDQIEDLRLHRHVERGCWFVCDDHVGFSAQG